MQAGKIRTSGEWTRAGGKFPAGEAHEVIVLGMAIGESFQVLRHGSGWKVLSGFHVGWLRKVVDVRRQS